jgi:hypothetical protein
MVLHRRYGSPSVLLAALGFWATLHAAPGRLWLERGDDTIELPEIEDVATGPVDTGHGIWMQGVIVTTLGDKFPLLPYERHGLLPHAIQDPSAIAEELREIVFGGSFA